MRRITDDQSGSAMVLAIGVMAVLAVLAVVVISIVIAEKRSSSSQYANDRAFYSADAAGEAGVHWVRGQLSPPALLDSLNSVRLRAGNAVLATDHLYDYSVQFATRRHRLGCSIEYKDYVYRVAASGTSAQQASAAVELNATRLYREGY
jgi:hypothetical protein